MIVKHSGPCPQENYETIYLVQFPNGQQEIVTVLPWMTEIGFDRDESLRALKGRLEYLTGEEVELKNDPTLLEQLAETLAEVLDGI